MPGRNSAGGAAQMPTLASTAAPSATARARQAQSAETTREGADALASVVRSAAQPVPDQNPALDTQRALRGNRVQ